jgi:hypothetical protein
MLVLQILTAALTISFAKANPLVVDVRNWENPTADGAFKRADLDVASPASNYAEYIPSPTETSLTYHYYQERATCLDQFVWYCQIPAGACIAAVANLVGVFPRQLYLLLKDDIQPTPVTLWSLLPCGIAALCGTVRNTRAWYELG